MAIQPRQAAPNFTADAVIGEKIVKVSLEDYRGQYVLMFFYPMDFTFVCPTEIIAFSDRDEEFRRLGVQTIAVSVDNPYSHLAWCRTPRNEGGLGEITYPIVADLTKSISRDYGVLLENDGISLRGLFLIDKEGVIRHLVVNDLPLGRSVDEALRMVEALQHFEQHGEVCPANWQPGSATITPDPEKSKSYFSQVAGK